MKKQIALAAMVVLGVTGVARADEASDCAAGDGRLLSGNVVGAPRFVAGKSLHGVELSHTHLRIRGDGDGQIHDLAIDNVFAAGYRPRDQQVPTPLAQIAVGQRVEACGLPYAGGMHWVHTNCGDTPSPADPNGWLKLLDADGMPGPNLEASETYCYLWPRPSHLRRRAHRGAH